MKSLLYGQGLGGQSAGGGGSRHHRDAVPAAGAPTGRHTEMVSGRPAANLGGWPGLPAPAVGPGGNPYLPPGDERANPYRGGQGVGSFGLPQQMLAPVIPAKAGLFPSVPTDGGLEARVAAMERLISQQNADIQGVKQDVGIGRQANQMMSVVDEQLRRLAGSQDMAFKRMRSLEEVIGASDTRGTGGQAHSERLRQLQADIGQSQSEQKKLESRLLQHMADIRQDLSTTIGSSVHEVDNKLSERLQQWGETTTEQLRREQEERQKLEVAVKEQAAAAAAEVTAKLLQLESHTLPTMDRSLREENTETRRQLAGQLTQLTSDIKGVIALSNDGDQKVRMELRDVQSMAQKGLLSLKVCTPPPTPQLLAPQPFADLPCAGLRRSGDGVRCGRARRPRTTRPWLGYSRKKSPLALSGWNRSRTASGS